MTSTYPIFQLYSPPRDAKIKVIHCECFSAAYSNSASAEYTIPEGTYVYDVVVHLATGDNNYGGEAHNYAQVKVNGTIAAKVRSWAVEGGTARYSDRLFFSLLSNMTLTQDTTIRLEVSTEGNGNTYHIAWSWAEAWIIYKG